MPRRPAHRTRRGQAWAAVIVMGAGIGAVAACDTTSNDEPQPVDSSPDPGADTYVAAIAEFLEVPEEPPAEPPDPLPVVYIIPIDGALGIDDQASVIDALAATHDVRFVDGIDAAVQADAPGRPPRDDAIVLAIGRVQPEPPHLVRIERYHTQIDVDATRLTLAYVVDRWVVLATETVPAEALTDAG